MFHATKPGTRKCIMCGKEAKGLVVKFDDGTLNGHLCFKDIQKATENREEETAAPENGRPHAVTT